MPVWGNSVDIRSQSILFVQYLSLKCEEFHSTHVLALSKSLFSDVSATVSTLLHRYVFAVFYSTCDLFVCFFVGMKPFASVHSALHIPQVR